MSKVIYVGFINETKAVFKRSISLAAETKGLYLVKLLSQMNHSVHVIVSAPLADSNASIEEENYEEEYGKLTLSPCQKRSNKILRFLDNRKRAKWLSEKVIESTDASSIVIVYHSGSLIRPLLKAKKKIGFKLIIEAEELYGLMPISSVSSKTEFAFFDRADGFIPITPKLNEAINKDNKPFAVFYGAYDLPTLVEKKNSNGKNIVFAGTFENGLNRGTLALEITKHLPQDFTMHLLASSNTDRAKTIVDDFLKANPNHCPIVFEGTKTGADFNNFLQTCDVAVSPQDDKTAFGLYSFPSKIVVYLANGLPVVATKLDVIANSPFLSCVKMVNENEPKAMAEAIISFANDEKKKNGREIIKEEAQRFEKQLKTMIEEVEEA